MDINSLASFTLEGCRFSKASYTFEFCGQLDGQFKTFLVSTSYSLSLPGTDRKDAEQNFSSIVWNMIERNLESVIVNNDGDIPAILFKFEGGCSFEIWSDEPLMDNMLIVTDAESDDWFPVC